MPEEARPARDLAAQLVTSAKKAGHVRAGAAGPAAAAFERLAAELSRWLGASGSHALLTRALKQAAADHPAVSEIGVIRGPEPRLDRLTETVEVRGGQLVGAGLEAALVALLELVGRLIGDDLSLKLVELSMTNGVSEGEREP